MAAGRGEFFRSLMEGLERTPGPPGLPGPGGPGSARACPCYGSAGGRRNKRWPKAASGCGGRAVRPEPKSKVSQAKPSSFKENFMERLPPEILTKILSYLDASSLFCVSHVSKLFHHLASDDVMWQKIYVSEFGSQTWKPKSVDEAVVKEETEEHPAGHWKKMYFRTAAGLELSRWRRELRELSPSTGLPRLTEWVLRNMNVSWELTVRDHFGQETMLEVRRTYFFETSVIVCWSGNGVPRYSLISNFQLHGVRRDSPKSGKVKQPGWRSLIWKLDTRTQRLRFIGKDRLIKLMLLCPGLVIGLWRGQSSIAFIMVSLHFHRLVEKSLLGSPVCSYSEPAAQPHVDKSDPKFGLHGYTLHFVLHNTGSQIMSGHFRHLSGHAAGIQRGLVELKAINRTNLSQHRSLSGNIKLPWKSEMLEGSVENCCVMSLTLLDEFQKPFWCVSAPIHITMAKQQLSFDYNGEHFLMEYRNPDGEVKMKLVWLKEQRQFFLISLIIYISVFKVNKHFSTKY
ncbi:F-box only protein 15 [Aulostomus maculatus]